MFSTSTPSSSTSTAQILASTKKERDHDVRMRDAGTAGGRKGSSRIKTHRLRGSGIDLYKAESGHPRTSLAARVNTVDPDGVRGAVVAIRGAARAAASTITDRPRRSAVFNSLREAVGTPLTIKVVDIWKEFVKKRYNPEVRFLNLENMAEDELIKKNGLIPPGQPGASYREGGVIFKIASRLEPEVQTISLANNGIKHLTHFSTMNTYLPKLANLSLQNNQIGEYSELDRICGRGTRVSLLRELILLNNPLRNNELQKQNLSHYSSEVKRRFPMLEMLDQEPVTKIEFDISSNVSRARRSSKSSENSPLTFPVPMAGNGIAEENLPIVGEFLTKYLTAFDSDRASLRMAYAPNAVFSHAANTSIPTRARMEGHHTSKEMPNQTKLEWTGWLENSRNLSRVGRSLEKAAKTLYTTVDEIVTCLLRLPKTKHDLAGAAEKFSYDAWPVDSILQGGEPAMFICLHGQFVEGPYMGVRSFDRSFMVAAAPNGSPAKLAGWDVIILSDQLIVRNYSSHKAWTPGPMKVVHDSHQLEALSDPQRQLVLQLSARTNLIYSFAIQCLRENAWDMERAFVNFEQVKSALGPEAFSS